jgi:hypothetical protein
MNALTTALPPPATAPRPWRERLDPRPGCGFCYRVLLGLLSPLGRLARRAWLGALLVYGLLGAFQAAVARAQERAAAAVTFDRAGWGPFTFATTSPLQNKRMVFLHESPRLHPAGSWFLRSSLTIANTWIFNRRAIIIDEDVWNLHQTFEYTFNDRMALALRLHAQFLGGGFMDGGIEQFHSTFGLGNQGREFFPRDRFHTEAFLSDGTVQSLLDAGKGDVLLRAPVISARFRLNGPDAAVPLTLKASVDLPRLESETRLVKRSGADWAVGLSAAKRFTDRLTGTASAAFVRSRPGTLLAPNDLKQRQSSVMVSLDYRLSDAWALVGQVLREDPVTRNTHTGFDRPSSEALFGAKYRISDRSVLEFAGVENFDVMDNTADFALHAAISTTFR